jgi:hypothetical protein
MLADNGIEVDIDALNELFERADVITIGFTLFPERLLIDTRAKGGEGPLIAIVAPVASIQERYLWLGQNRPNFGAPQAFSFFPWPHTVRRFVEQDVFAPLRSRLSLAANDGPAVLEESLATLIELERLAIRAAIRGEQPWLSLWPRAA